MMWSRRVLTLAATALAFVALTAVGAGRSVVGAQPATGGAVRAAAPEPQRWVMGYYPLYQRGLMPPSETIDWSSMTHLVVGAVIPRADGSLDTTFYDDAVHGPKIAKQLADEALAHHVKPILMVGGAGTHDAFATAATHHRAKLVDSLVSAMRAGDFDGLDLDWEPVSPGEGPAVVALVTALRERLPQAILTMPVLWVTTTFPKVPSFYRTLSSKLDRIDVMTYGMAGKYQGWKTWHSSALKGATASTPSDIAINVTSFEAAGVPAAKLGIGIGFYGTCWAGGVTRPRERIGSSHIVADDNVMTYTRIMATYFSHAAYHYDKTAQAPYLGFSRPKGPEHCTYVSYEDPRSVAAKGAYAEQQGLGSEVVWTINQGHVKGVPASRSDPLLRAVRRSFH